MKTIRRKIEEHAKAKNARWDIVEKDYALSYVLKGITEQPDLMHTLIFKGGTALKKIYFEDYRFSEDLDFSAINAPKGQALENALLDAIEIARRHLHVHGPFELKLLRKPERSPHPRGQEAFNVHIKFPEHPTNSLCVIKLEVTHDEPVVLPVAYFPLFHAYEEQMAVVVACYHIEEVIAEKLRALLQTHEKLVARGWNRPRARDYYDLWNVLKYYGNSVQRQRLLSVLKIKCEHRNVSYSSIDDFFTLELTTEANKHWHSSLHLQTRNLPDCQSLLNETKELINAILF